MKGSLVPSAPVAAQDAVLIWRHLDREDRPRVSHCADLIARHDEDATVADLAGASRLSDGLDGLVNEIIRDDGLDPSSAGG